jgi:hypothetical protein
VLDLLRINCLLLVVKEQSRFVLADSDWNELKKLRPIGTAAAGPKDEAGAAGICG